MPHVKSLHRISLPTLLCAAQAFAQSTHPAPDSTSLILLRLDLARAQVEQTSTNFWHRLIPKVTVSASFGMHGLLAVDPVTSELIPRDAYRVTLSLGLSDLLDGTRHETAQIEAHALKVRYWAAVRQITRKYEVLSNSLDLLRRERALLEEEESTLTEILHFNEMLFQQGKIDFDALARSKLQLLNVRKSIIQLEHRRIDLTSEGAGQ